MVADQVEVVGAVFVSVRVEMHGPPPLRWRPSSIGSCPNSSPVPQNCSCRLFVFAQGRRPSVCKFADRLGPRGGAAAVCRAGLRSAPQGKAARHAALARCGERGDSPYRCEKPGGSGGATGRCASMKSLLQCKAAWRSDLGPVCPKVYIRAPLRLGRVFSS